MSDLNYAEKFKFPVPQNMDRSAPVLIVEDQQDLRLIVTHHLNKLNFTTIWQAANGLEALDILSKNKKSAVVLCDFDMPILGGLDLLHEIREKPDVPRGPFCLMMGDVSKEKVMLAVETGVDEMLVKPFTQGDILPKMLAAFKIFNNPKNPERAYEFAKTLLVENKLDEAGKVYQVLAQAAPKAARPSVGLARVALGQKNMEEALKHLVDAEAKNPNYVHLYAVRGNIYSQTNQFDQAILAFQKAIEISPLNPVRYQSAAEVLFKVNRYQEAQTLLAMALKHQLEFPNLHHYMSQASFALKDYPGALKSIKHALAQSPENVTYLNQLGICYKEAGEFEEATKTYNRIIKLDPDNTAALYNKAVMMNTKGDVAEAIRLLEKLLKKQPDFKPAMNKLTEFKKAVPAPAATKTTPAA